jgi:hypothetical protein
MKRYILLSLCFLGFSVLDCDKEEPETKGCQNCQPWEHCENGRCVLDCGGFCPQGMVCDKYEGCVKGDDCPQGCPEGQMCYKGEGCKPIGPPPTKPDGGPTTQDSSTDSDSKSPPIDPKKYFAHLCEECGANKPCPREDMTCAVIDESGENFCTVKCPLLIGCPTGFECRAILDEWNNELGRWCFPSLKYKAEFKREVRTCGNEMMCKKEECLLGCKCIGPDECICKEFECIPRCPQGWRCSLGICVPPTSGQEEKMMWYIVNRDRRVNGSCGPDFALDFSDDLAAIAREHSSYMLKYRDCDHVEDNRLPTRTLQDRLRRGGIICELAGENVACGFRTIEDAQAALMLSPGHRANILNCNYTHIGIGVVKAPDGGFWITQVFCRNPRKN